MSAADDDIRGRILLLQLAILDTSNTLMKAALMREIRQLRRQMEDPS